MDRCGQGQRRQRLGRERWGLADGFDLQKCGGHDQTAPAGQCISQLAMRLEQGVVQKSDTSGFFNRMSQWFRK